MILATTARVMGQQPGQCDRQVNIWLPSPRDFNICLQKDWKQSKDAEMPQSLRLYSILLIVWSTIVVSVLVNDTEICDIPALVYVS